MTIATTTSTRAGGSNFMRRALDRMIEARSAQARRYVNGYLLSLDDATLATHGYDREQLEREGASASPFSGAQALQIANLHLKKGLTDEPAGPFQFPVRMT